MAVHRSGHEQPHVRTTRGTKMHVTGMDMINAPRSVQANRKFQKMFCVLCPYAYYTGSFNTGLSRTQHGSIGGDIVHYAGTMSSALQRAVPPKKKRACVIPIVLVHSVSCCYY